MFGVCVCVLRHAEKKRGKNTYVGFKNASVCPFKTSPCMPATTRTCVETCARGAGTDGYVLNVHTGTF